MDINCMDQTWITIGAGDLTVDLNGEIVTSIGPWYQGSCQEGSPADDFGCPSPKCRPRQKQRDFPWRTLEDETQIEPGVITNATMLSASNL
jgi:hypothetical protein